MKVNSLITIALTASLLLGCTGGTKKSDGTRESGDARESVMTLAAAKEAGGGCRPLLQMPMKRSVPTYGLSPG